MSASRRLHLPLLPRWARYAAAALVFTAVTVGSVTGDAPPPPPGFGDFFDKYLHFAAYAGLALALAYATAHWRDAPYRRAAIVFTVAVGYGLLMEFVQAPIPNRYFSLADALANALGASLVVVWFLVERRVRYQRRWPSGKPE
jgi:VanZ family protein